MPTKNPRINVTFEESTAEILATLAKQENKSVSSITKELVLQALELREDLVFSSLAESRESKNEKKISHEDAWK